MTYSPSTPFNDYLRGEQTKYPELTLEAIETLKMSLKEDRELPPITDKMYLAFLQSCIFDTELAKKTIKKYYSYHNSIPQVFCELDPLTDDIKQFIKCMSICQMPSVNLDKSYRVVYMHIKNTNHRLFEFVPLFKYVIMWIKHTLLMYGTCDGITFVFNNDGLSWRHVLKLPMRITHIMLQFLELGIPFRLKEIHLINASSATQMLMKIIARFTNEDLMAKMKVHSVGSDDIFNFVSKSMLPVEAGGTGISYNPLTDELYEHLINNRNMYLEENEIVK